MFSTTSTIHFRNRLSVVLCYFCLFLGWSLALGALLLSATPVSAETTGLKGALGDQKGKDLPLYVKSESLSLDAKGRVFTYSGNVEIVRGDVTITCDSMKGTYNEQSKLEKVLCKDNVVITRGEEMRAIANRAEYDVPASIIVLTEGPELAREGNVLSADKITIFVDEDRSQAEGNVRVKVIKAETGQPASASLMGESSSSSSERAIDPE